MGCVTPGGSLDPFLRMLSKMPWPLTLCDSVTASWAPPRARQPRTFPLCPFVLLLDFNYSLTAEGADWKCPLEPDSETRLWSLVSTQAGQGCPEPRFSPNAETSLGRSFFPLHRAACWASVLVEEESGTELDRKFCYPTAPEPPGSS